MSNYISYDNLLRERNNFKKAGSKSGSEFNYFDTPGLKYFKIFFYFNNGDASGNQSVDSSNGLLSPTWLVKNTNDSNYHMYNSAWSYLKMNDEDDRADLLKDFVNLLSNISSESPWYFSEISGLDAAMDRKAINAENFTIEQTRPKITIKCLPDAIDDRIGTLLDLYRSVVWDWTSKREIVPSNLRKFDMGLFIFETPNVPFHKLKKPGLSLGLMDEYASVGENVSGYATSYKYIEFHNCEIDYNSSKTLYASLNNKDGMSIEHNIEIFFDDCYETRYNEFLLKEMGDLIKNSIQQRYSHNINANELDKRVNFFENPGTHASGGLIKKAVLGNLYTLSLTKLSDQVKGLIQSDIISSTRHMDSYIGGSINKNRNKNTKITTSNIFPQKSITPTVKYIGKLYQGDTIANNI
jgi:hypothetical protein